MTKTDCAAWLLPDSDMLDYTTKRHPDCPLLELHPHGDLIDRSDVLAVVDEAYEYGDVIERRDFDENNILTIVPAERSGE